MDFSIAREPLYLKVKKAILEGVHRGEFGKDSLLPPENVLSDKFHVSRSTIRSALQSLEKDNVIRKRHGVGTFLIPESLRLPMRIDQGKGFFELIREIGRNPSIREEGISKGSVPEAVTRQLRAPRGVEVCTIKRTLLGDGEPAIHIREYIPTMNLMHSMEHEKLPNSIFEIADKFCIDRIGYSISEIIPSTVNSLLAKVIGLTKGNPILKLEEVHYSRGDSPLIFSEVWVNDRIIRFRVLRSRERS